MTPGGPPRGFRTGAPSSHGRSGRVPVQVMKSVRSAKSQFPSCLVYASS
jgi:hypothetical protein